MRCCLCGSDKRRPLFEWGEGSEHEGIYECLGCRLVYRVSVKQPDESAWEEYPELSDRWIEGRKRVFYPYMEMIDRFKEKGRILDVGAGHGFFLDICRGRGWECSGVELSEQAAEYAAKEFGLDIIRKPLQEAELPAGEYDLVTFWNVLDHLDDPVAALEEAQKLLRPGGLVIVRVPNAAFHVPARKLFHKAGRDPSVIHNFSFNRRTLKFALEKSGFGQFRFMNAPLSWTTSHDAGKNFCGRLMASMVYGMAQVLSAATLGCVLVAPSITAVASKPE